MTWPPRLSGPARPVPVAWRIDHVREALREEQICVAVPSYGDGNGVVPTLQCVHEALAALDLPRCAIFLSDSGPDATTVVAARAWADASGARLVIDRSEERRSKKQALNVAFDSVEGRAARVVVHVDADVTFSPASFAALVGCLLDGDRDAAIGLKLPDPSARRLSQRAGAWQLGVVARFAYGQPDDYLRAEGSFVALSRAFLEDFRYPIGEVAAIDDVALVSILRSQGRRAGNAWAAVDYAIPPGSVHDFGFQTYRHLDVTEDNGRSAGQLTAAVRAGLTDPVGAAAYVTFRVLARLRRDSIVLHDKKTETWARAESTLRRGDRTA